MTARARGKRVARGTTLFRVEERYETGLFNSPRKLELAKYQVTGGPNSEGVYAELGHHGIHASWLHPTPEAAIEHFERLMLERHARERAAVAALRAHESVPASE